MGNSPARSNIDVGSVIAGTYTIEGLIGQGGMGAVFVASHNRLPGKQVAIKLLHAELDDEEIVARFRREALIASQLNHPNIVGVTDFNVTPDGMPYLVLEYLHGETLAQRLKHGPMPVDQTLALIRQVGSAVAAAHREGIVHRDLKPQNIFLVTTEVSGHSVEIAKVLDFGISKIRGSSTVQTQESTLLGTPQYMAPEQATGQHASIDDRTDVFALGAIVYEMLSGKPAFSGASIPEVVFKVVYEPPAPLTALVPELPDGIRAAVEQAMAKRPDDRFASVSAFVEALTGFPLATLRPSSIAVPEVGFATGSRHRPPGGKPGSQPGNQSNIEAFAQTMGSLDQTGSPLTAPARPSAISADGATVGMPSNRPIASAGATVATTSGTAAPPHPAAPRGRSLGLVIAIAVGGAAIAAVVMYIAMRRPDQPAVVTAPIDARTDAALVAMAAVDAAPPPIDAAPTPPPIDAALATTRPDARHHATPPDIKEDTAPEDDQAAGQLAQADTALAQGQHDLAERLANSVINSPGAGKKQLAHAAAIHGAIECSQRNSREGAQIDLRKIGNRPKFRRMLIAACARAGIELR